MQAYTKEAYFDEFTAAREQFDRVMLAAAQKRPYLASVSGGENMPIFGGVRWRRF